jgi:hypothetical protein
MRLALGLAAVLEFISSSPELQPNLKTEIKVNNKKLTN